MMHRAPTLHRLSRADAAALRSRSAPRGTLTFDDAPLGSGSVRLSVNHGRLGRADYDTCLSLNWGVDRLELHCPASLLRQVLSAFESALEVEAIPSDLAALLLEAALLPIIVRLEQATGRDITINGVRAERLDAAPEGSLGLLLEKESQRWSFLLFARPIGSGRTDPLEALLGFWPVVPRHMPRFRLATALRIGTTQLSYTAFMSLRLGDAVLLQIGDGSSGMLVVAEAWTAIAEQHGLVWRLVEAPKPAAEIKRMGWTMRGIDVEEAPVNAPINDPDQLPVHLTFDVGRLEISLGELRRLGPGSVVELPRSIAAPVCISAQGRPVGQGELIDVEGVVGVKITKLFDYE